MNAASGKVSISQGKMPLEGNRFGARQLWNRDRFEFEPTCKATSEREGEGFP
jgi:hypothetical protein